MRRSGPPKIDRATVVRLWLHRQGLSSPRGSTKLSKRSVSKHLETTGALQLDSVNVLDRAHYLTLWSRFGAYDRERLDRLVYRDRVGYEYWGHETSILPISHLPIGLRRMRRFPPPSWRNSAWWQRFDTAPSVKRGVMRRLRNAGPLESADFEKRPDESGPEGPPGGTVWLQKEAKRALQLLWHAGKVAIRQRRHFRRVYDLAERCYPEVEPNTGTAYEDSWLLTGLSGNGIASERHLVNYLTAPEPKAAERKRIIARSLKKGRIVELCVDEVRGSCYALPEHLDTLRKLPEPTGTTLICPFDSLLWQRERAEELLGFHYRIEIYVPPAKRKFGYYMLPILHEGRLVGRLDPKLHRDTRRLEIKSIFLEPGFKRDLSFDRALGDALADLQHFVAADEIELPRGWRRLI